MFRHFFIALAIVSSALCIKGQQLPDDERAMFRAAKTTRIIVKQSYASAPAVNLAFEKTLQGLMKYLGLVAAEPQQEADITFEVDAHGSALGRTYIGQTRQGSGKHLFTGATVTGTLQIRAGNGKGITRSFSGTIEPKQSVFDTETDQSTTPAEAPFNSAFVAGKSNFLDVLGELLINIYGPVRIATAFLDADLYISGIGREGLLRLEPAMAVSMSLDAIRQPSPLSREGGYSALFSIVRKFPQTIDQVYRASSDPDANVRVSIIHVFSALDDPRARDVLIQALSDSEKFIRILAAGRLEGTYDNRATEPLLVLLRDRDPALRRSAAAALKGAGARAVAPLISALKDKDPDVRLAAHESLKAFSRQHFGADPKPWQEWWKEKKPIYEKAEADLQKYLEMERQRTKPKP